MMRRRHADPADAERRESRHRRGERRQRHDQQAEQRDRRDRLQQVQHRENRSLPMRPAGRGDAERKPDQQRRADRGRDEFDMADQRGGERCLAGAGIRGPATARRTARPPPSPRTRRRRWRRPRDSSPVPARGALQRIDDRQRSGAGQDPERGAERYPRQGPPSPAMPAACPDAASTQQQQRHRK